MKFRVYGFAVSGLRVQGMGVLAPRKSWVDLFKLLWLSLCLLRLRSCMAISDQGTLLDPQTLNPNCKP